MIPDKMTLGNSYIEQDMKRRGGGGETVLFIRWDLMGQCQKPLFTLNLTSQWCEKQLGASEFTTKDSSVLKNPFNI